MPKKTDEKKIIAQPEPKTDWLEENFDGQLAIDVYQTPESIVIKSTIAGVQPEDLDVTVNNDMVTIRGVRKQDDTIEEKDYFFQECYWGGFSRSVVLPVDVDPENVKATIKNGVLTVVLPKIKKTTTARISVDTEE